jgi:2-keto-3-deoxy-L-fuconate dehydrogenase
MTGGGAIPKGGRLGGLSALVTQADAFMGPAVTNLFRAEGAEVVADCRDLREISAAQTLVEEAGHIDILVANLMFRNTRTPAHETSDEDWARMFDVMVHPLHRLIRAVLPQMLARGRGKVVVMGSANGLRGTSIRSAYSAARGAQLSYVRSVGVEVAPAGVCVNAIAQNFVSNPTSYPAEVTGAPEFQARLAEVPIGRIARGEESAALALFLAGPESDFMVGQVISFAGGWA